ncbi:5'-methylthioadenosine/adenosylhomocysteine nucleosidase [Clostridium tarantellae]|uniref:adenosylhomocysteine nucleosidase n=1 Tax=Clostridium tarantellae TaxID=39493 RepID=A0A6I1MWX2_9CLOT|nr:5'-methylthioadenosine/adenosylhomocysteine nucleosidase [Clostridium tarantellae]MPQ45291.1 5'-methylthioadenosine/adenosylhomocysteine nucleosidase [Clostridium tarantellae]
MFGITKKRKSFREEKIIGIIGTINSEINKIKNFLNIISEEKHIGLKFYIAKYKNLDIVLVEAGIGKVNVASCTQILIDKFNICQLINTGVAGALKDNINICDIIIVDEVTYHDVRKARMQNSFPYKESFISDRKLLEIAVEGCDDKNFKIYDYHIGKCVTGEAFISDNEFKEIILADHDSKCVDMEGAAIAHVCDINNVPFIAIKSISDKADENANKTYEKFENIATNNSSKLLLNMLNIINEYNYI